MYLISYLGNRGFKRENLKRDKELLYHNVYMILCILGLVVHNFFYSILVSVPTGIQYLYRISNSTSLFKLEIRQLHFKIQVYIVFLETYKIIDHN